VVPTLSQRTRKDGTPGERVRGTAVIDPINRAAHPTTFAYEIMNRLTRITYPDGSSVSFGYDYRRRRNFDENI